MSEAEAVGWKARLDIPVNYTTDSEDDFEVGEVVTRAAQRRRDASAAYLLADRGDGAPADLLGTTPPRLRIRNKEIRRNNMDTDVTLNRLLRANRRNTVDAAYVHEFCAHAPPDPPERSKKRGSLKCARGRERDMKLEVGQAREHRSDSLPSPSCQPAEFMASDVPTVVESCNRFMSLSSRLKCPLARERSAQPEPAAEGEALPRSLVDFHNTFSMLIKMGNVDKNCRRAISVEEQVWQNERKDLIWLELRARIAGRTLQQQDEYLCVQRQVIPTIVQNINNYRFVNTTPCKQRTSRHIGTPASEGYHSLDEAPASQWNGADPLNTITENKCQENYDEDDERYQIFGCLCLECDACSGAVGKALKEVGTLLDSFYNAETLYPSSKAMAAKHPLVATKLFHNRLKAMCLWYNIAHHLRLKLLGIRRLIKLLQWKAYSRQRSQQKQPDTERGSAQDSLRPPVVQFQLEHSPSGSDSSSGRESLPEPRGDETDCAAPPAAPVVASGAERDGQEWEGEPRGEEGTVDTSSSGESGYSSERSRVASYHELLACCDESYDVIDVGPLSDVTRLRLLANCDVSPYRYYISDILKTQGLRKALMFIDKMRQYILKRAYMTFEKYNSSQQSQHQECDQTEIFDDTKDPKDDELQTGRCRYESAKNAFELRRYGCWSEETLQMRLPSYRSTFLLLSTVCMEVIHDYLTMRLETQPAKPSCLTVKQLMHELKEGLDIATEQRSAFVRNVDTALAGFDTGGDARRTFLTVVRVFDCTIERVLTQYLSYLTTVSEVEHMPRSLLEAEWCFAARLARRTKCAAMLAPQIFANIMSNQIEGVTVRFRNKFRLLTQNELQPQDGSDTDDDSSKRHWVYAICRQAQSIFVSERELTVQTAQFSRLLATRLRRNPCMESAREKIFNSLMNARNCIVEYIDLITKKTESRPWEEDAGLSDVQSIVVRVRELLLQGYKLGFEFHKELHRFMHPSPRWSAAQPPGPRRRPASLQPLTERHPTPRRPGSMLPNESYNVALGHLFHKELHRYANDAGGERCRTAAPAQRRPSSVCAPARGRPRLARADSVGGDIYSANVFNDLLQSTGSVECGVPELLFDEEEPPEGAGEPPAPAHRLDAAWAESVARAIIDFAKNWMRFVTVHCDRGRGLRPRWASQGLEFLMLACDPCNTKYLSEAEFEELKSCMDGCISHVVGSRSPAAAAPAQAATPPPPRGRHGSRTYAPHPLIQMQSMHKQVPTPPTPPLEPDPVVVFHIAEETQHSRAAAEAARRIDQARDAALLRRRMVGRVVEAAVAAAASQEPKLRQVTFRWQRGLKIGAGSFGKVYTVVNTESGQLLAMKEISIGPGDRRALQKAANELKVLEGILHPHLVRHYGCEVHREEMLIFMELCVEGSLEALLAESGPLPEPAVRRYTKQLVSAVLELHGRQIAHRDIKTGNIFLTNERHCLKLGDFGCAVKIRANTTAAGELQGYVGTQAYMAPEVFMKSSGHGRAADIWSLGCVVTEMSSGKRPFSEYDSNYQIMFVVGMGGRPDVPASLSEEGREFCLACLEHDPDARASAADIVDHHFLKLKDEDQCDCETGYLISK